MRGLSERVTAVMPLVSMLSGQSHHLLIMVLMELIRHKVRLLSQAHGKLEALGTIHLLDLILQVVRLILWCTNRVSGST